MLGGSGGGGGQKKLCCCSRSTSLISAFPSQAETPEDAANQRRAGGVAVLCNHR